MMQAAHTQSSEVGNSETGWYLYGIVRREVVPALTGGQLQALECGSVAAVTKTVPIADFSDEALQKRLQDPAELQALVTGHNAVIAAIHQEESILPAKFGGVYARVDDLVAAIEQQHRSLAAQLDRVAGCDEWAARVYVDREQVSEAVIASEPELDLLRREIAGAKPGRAYLLQRKLSEGVAHALDRTLAAVARQCFEHLALAAVAAQTSPPLRPSSGAQDEQEILRAAFLVKREQFDTFAAGLEALMSQHHGLRGEYSGPWPPYSFASLSEEESR